MTSPPRKTLPQWLRFSVVVVVVLLVGGSLSLLAANDDADEPDRLDESVAQARAKVASALSYGGGSCGRLEGGVALLCSGEGYEAFTSVACGLGRNHLHPLVARTITDAYAALYDDGGKRVWQYGEMGLREGGPLPPHKTHQNGLSADFFLPMKNADGSPAKLPISALERFGYDLELDDKGRLGELQADFAAIAAHLLALEEAGKERGVRVERVILTPAFHRALFRAAPELERLRARFMKREAWVRHDEHYHVDFTIPKAQRRPLSCKKR